MLHLENYTIFPKRLKQSLLPSNEWQDDNFLFFKTVLAHTFQIWNVLVFEWEQLHTVVDAML